MNTDLIIANVSRFVTLTPPEESLLLSLVHAKKIRRRQYLLEEGDVCDAVAFVTQGCLRSFVVDGNGDEHVLQFAPEDWWIADMASRISRKPGMLYIEAIEESELLLLAVRDEETLLLQAPKFERFFRALMERSFVAQQQRLIDNLSLSAEDRYRNFLAKYPSLVHRVPQKHIASFLGVTAEFFSTMRRNYLNKS